MEEQFFRDSDGLVIDFGNRWPDSPPEETYSVETHLERFAPIHAVADALIAHLRDTYDVEISEGDAIASDLLRPAHFGAARAVRVRPNHPSGASLTFVYTAHPGLVVHAGLLHDFRFPVCGCDACDSTWHAEADQLERMVLAVVTGHYRESVEGQWVAYAFTFPDGASSGRSLSPDLPEDRLKEAGPILRALPAGWAAWPPATP